MRAAIAVAAGIAPAAGGRRIAVLGDMFELGADSEAEHEALAAPILAAGIDLVFTCGPRMRRLHDALPAAVRGGHGASSEEIAPVVAAALRGGDVVVVKGSLASRMQRVVDALAGSGTNARR
jgi:UDP-N-acetylmuramoyl-tripeptide--D-alanyl-D-alanine ligase